MSVIQVRAIGPTGDPLYGAGLQCFITDLAATAQNIRTAILLLKNEFFTSIDEGTPLFQQLLDHPITNQAAAMILQGRILSVPHVTGISSLWVNYQGAGRTFQFRATVETEFGPVQVGNA